MFRTKIGGVLARGASKKLGPLLISATVETINFKFGIQLRHGRGLDPSMGWIGLGWVGLGWVENFPVLVGWVGLGLFTHMVIFFVNLTILLYIYLSLA